MMNSLGDGLPGVAPGSYHLCHPNRSLAVGAAKRVSATATHNTYYMIYYPKIHIIDHFGTIFDLDFLPPPSGEEDPDARVQLFGASTYLLISDTRAEAVLLWRRSRT